MIAKAIWGERRNTRDEYMDFTADFRAVKGEKVLLRISVDDKFAAYCNGELCAFGFCQNFPNDKEALVFDITPYCEKENSLKITAWHEGTDTSTCFNLDAYLAFTVECDGKVVLTSDGSVRCSRNLNYRSGYAKSITSQLGYSFYYDNTVFCDAGRAAPACVFETETFRERELANLKLGARRQATVTEEEDGYLIDLGAETVGFLDMDISCDEECELVISYGEHLKDGKVPRKIDGRDFSVEFRAGIGRNLYMNPYRRLAGRYLFVNSKKIHITYLGIRVVEFPILANKVKFEDKTLQKIYDTSVYTLKCCMHEHYEDCPWREQALYALDSRNQMLAGYYAFRGHKFQRENLLLLAKSQLENGLLNICAPAGIVLPIPFFSLVYPMQVAEYLRHTEDTSILSEVGDTVRRILACFKGAIDETGLVPILPPPAWNFYEWSKGSDAYTATGLFYAPKTYDLILNLAYLRAVSYADEIFGEQTDTEEMKARVKETFFDPERGLYRLSTAGDAAFSVLGNAMAILAGLGDHTLMEKILTDKTLIPVTLSMNTFFYDALLTFDGYEDVILADILKKYVPMLEAGATTFWETEEGAEAFGGAGSLCHGWSAMPAYYLRLLKQEKKRSGETL